jgi:hypothetical protein
MNPLSNVPGTWKGDGSVEEGQSSLFVEGSTISLASAKAGVPLNVIYETTSSSSSGSSSSDDTTSPSQFISDYYFEITLEEMEDDGGTLAVGVVAAAAAAAGGGEADEFKAGWDVRGMFLKNGSLNNGHETLKQGFYSGPPGEEHLQGHQPQCDQHIHLQVQDVIGVRYIHKEPHTSVIFYLNNNCLGTGFRLYNVHKPFMPCVHVDGKMLLSWSFPVTAPAQITRPPPERPLARYEGQYKLMEAYAGAALHAVPFPKADSSRDITHHHAHHHSKDIILHMHKDTEHASTTNKFAIAIHVGNTFNTKMLILEECEETGAKIQVAKGKPSIMAVNAKFAALESFLASSLEHVVHMELREKTGKFVWNGPDCRMIWHVHHDTSAEYCTSYY